MNPNKYQIVIGYSNTLVCDGLEILIDKSNEFEVKDRALLGSNLIDLLNHGKIIDILIVELNYPQKKDLRLIQKIVESHPNLGILVVSLTPHNSLASSFLESGIHAYILKSCNKSDLLIALKKVKEQSNYFCSTITKSILVDHKHGEVEQKQLTDREKEVLGLLVKGNTNTQVSKYLGLTESTVKTHRRNIQNKFGVNNLIGMIRFACRANFIDFGDDEFCANCPHCFQY